MFYEMLYYPSANVSGTFKILLLKFSVGLIVIQGLIEEFLFATGYITIGDSDSYSAEERAQRGYCLVVIFEYAFLSIAVFYAYSTEILPAESVDGNGSSGGSIDGLHSDAKTSQPNSASDENEKGANSSSGSLEVAGTDSVNGTSGYTENSALGQAMGLESADVTLGEYVRVDSLCVCVCMCVCM